VISIFPVGAPLVWIPASLWLLTQGETGWGIFMALYGGLVISSVDNVIRPWMIARGANLPLLLTLMGALGGVLAFGFLGLFLGPVVLAVGYTLMLEFAGTVEREGKTPSPPSPPAL
jgi:predicted PurR-regulated permease PerM